MEARGGIEPTDEAFAEPCLTTWLPRRERTLKLNSFCHPRKFNRRTIREPQLMPMLPQFLRLENSGGRDDAGDQFRRRHVKARIARAAGWIRHANIFTLTACIHAPRAKHFAFVPVFDGYVKAVSQIPVNRRKRNGDIKWNFMPRGENGLGVGADFIGYFAGATERAVAANDDQINFPALHQMPGGVVGDDLMRNFLLREFPRGERRALRTRSGLTAEDLKFLALRLRGIQRRGGAAHVHKREPAGVAVGENTHAVANQLRAMPANGFTVAHVF